MNCFSFLEINRYISSHSLSSRSHSFSSSFFSSVLVKPIEMYRDIFSSLDLEEKGKQETGKYNLILLKMKYDKRTKEKKGVLNIAIHNGLKELEEVIESDKTDFCVLSSISYAGRNNNHINARFMYALVIDLDCIIKDKKTNGLKAMEIYYKSKWVAKPNYIVSSGHGLHLYYVFEKPVPMYKNNQDLLFDLKKQIVKTFWTEDISAVKEQHGNILQGFRVAGTYTKDLKHKAKCFKTYDKKYTPYELAQVFFDKDQIKEISQYKNMVKLNSITLEQAKKIYPEWYRKRIIKKQPKGKWNIKRDLYDWYLRRIEKEKTLGHRYYCCMCLVVYAIKCDIPFEEVKKDLERLQPIFDNNPDNRFTKQDIKDALKIYDDDVATYTRARIELLSAISMPPNKRNYLKQKDHLEIARAILKVKRKQQIEKNDSREKIYKYLKDYPNDSLKNIMEMCCVSINTASKYRRLFQNQNQKKRR